MKTKNLIILFFVLISSFSFSQERVNRQKNSFIEKSQVLTTATGWCYDNLLGEWIDFPNVISCDKSYKNQSKILAGEYHMSHEYDNFIWIQTRTILVDSNKYFILIIEKWGGDYEYPTIYRNWRSYKKTCAYIFTPNEYQKIHNLEKQISLFTYYYVELGSTYQEYDETLFLSLIESELKSQPSSYEKPKEFPILLSNEGLIRFRIPNVFDKYYKYDFNKEYFEVKKSDFEKILLR